MPRHGGIFAAAMAPPRLVGGLLRNVRRVAETRAGVMIIRPMMERDFGLDRLATLPPDARCAADIEPRPLQAAPPRTWTEGALGPPSVHGHRRTTAQLAAAFRDADATPTDVFARLAKHIGAEDWGDALHSPFVALDLERARRDASASTDRHRAGKALGALDGVPVPIKDQHHLVGHPTRGGTAYLTSNADTDARMVQDLRAAGALVYAKTHTTEWGMTPTGQSPHFAMPRNAYHSDHCAGGSSTGAAIASALGLCTVASGSDGGGSIRIPSSLNGVFGIKPTFIRISRTGDIYGGTVGVTGPLGQSTLDLVAFLEATAVHIDPLDPRTTYANDHTTVAATWRRALGRGVTGCRIGVPRAMWEGADPAIVSACDEALRALERDGAIVRDVEIPYVEHAMAVGVMSIAPEAAGELGDDCERFLDKMSDDLRVSLAVLRSLKAVEVYAAQKTRSRLRRLVREAFTSIDLLALPSTAVLAPSYPRTEQRVAVSDVAAVVGLTRTNFLGNITGLPAGSVPVGRSNELPIGLQLIGDAWDEASVLAAMAHVERIGLADQPKPRGYFDLLG